MFTNYTSTATPSDSNWCFDMFKISVVFITVSKIGSWFSGSTPLRVLSIIVNKTCASGGIETMSNKPFLYSSQPHYHSLPNEAVHVGLKMLKACCLMSINQALTVLIKKLGEVRLLV